MLQLEMVCIIAMQYSTFFGFPFTISR